MINIVYAYIYFSLFQGYLIVVYFKAVIEIINGKMKMTAEIPTNLPSIKLPGNRSIYSNGHNSENSDFSTPQAFQARRH